jgi:hypothetical protein
LEGLKASSSLRLPFGPQRCSLPPGLLAFRPFGLLAFQPSGLSAFLPSSRVLKK